MELLENSQYFYIQRHRARFHNATTVVPGRSRLVNDCTTVESSWRESKLATTGDCKQGVNPSEEQQLKAKF